MTMFAEETCAPTNPRQHMPFLHHLSSASIMDPTGSGLYVSVLVSWTGSCPSVGVGLVGVLKLQGFHNGLVILPMLSMRRWPLLTDVDT